EARVDAAARHACTDRPVTATAGLRELLVEAGRVFRFACSGHNSDREMTWSADRGRRRRAAVALVVAVVAALAYGAGVQADAPDPKLDSTTGTVVRNADGSYTLTIQGQWQWTTHLSDCNTNRYGVGFAVD